MVLLTTTARVLDAAWVIVWAEYVDVFVTRTVDRLELVWTSMLVVPADV